jgi:hypothetical protein
MITMPARLRPIMTASLKLMREMNIGSIPGPETGNYGLNIDGTC